MAERPNGKTLTANELVLQKLKETFDRNGNVTTDSNGTNVWVMLVVSEPCSDLLEKDLPYPPSNQKPTHRVRVVLRTTDAQTGTNPYVDGSDFFLAVDEQQQSTDFVWEDESFGNAPLFHGGEVVNATLWVKELGEPFHVEFKDPFLTKEQRLVLNGHDEVYPAPARRREQVQTKEEDETWL
ncbi:hypothetical protein [Paenibacillus sp. GP183]|uniref:hypothetical protein n=1 Tax=Paenibacillus sp. GP183 TaxID=1882751 RepID=UPI000897BF93|nr:hypothetical protein [Paenibacillus sp. GP183]SED13150.1 hypothetical protein SAMN05443246_5842 [Paenibacillus sp. GP183]